MQAHGTEEARHKRLPFRFGKFFVSGASQLWQNLRRYAKRCPAVLVLLLFLPCCHFWMAYQQQHDIAGWREEPYKRWLPFPDCHGSIRGLVTDISSGGGDGITWNARVRLLALQTEEGWQRTSGMVMARGGGKWPCAGDVMEWEGAFFCPPRSDFLRGYFFSLGISRLFYVQAGHRLPDVWQSGCLRWLQRVSAALGNSLTDGMLKEEHAGLYRAMVLGDRSGLTSREKQVFLKSASIHVFTISGLHVMMMAGVLLFISRMAGASHQWRFFLVMPFLVLYVMISGAGPSSLRAAFMASGGFAAQIFWRNAVPENNLALAALALLGWNPGWIGHVGFQFSFVLVFFLLHSRAEGEKWKKAWGERRLWIPAERKPRIATSGKWSVLQNSFRRFIRRLSEWRGNACRQMAFSALVAWLAGAGLMARWNGMLSWSALGVNLLLPGMASWLIAMAVPKWLLGAFWPVGGRWLGRLVEWCIACLRCCAELGAVRGNYLYFPAVSGGSVMLYYGCLLVFLGKSAGRSVRLAAGAILLVCLLWWCLGGGQAECRRNFSAREPGESAVLGEVCVPQRLHVQAGGRQSSLLFYEEMQRRGMQEWPVSLSVGAPGDLAGARMLLQRANVVSLELPQKRGKAMRHLAEEAAFQGIAVSRGRAATEGDAPDARQSASRFPSPQSSSAVRGAKTTGK